MFQICEDCERPPFSTPTTAAFLLSTKYSTTDYGVILLFLYRSTYFLPTKYIMRKLGPSTDKFSSMGNCPGCAEEFFLLIPHGACCMRCVKKDSAETELERQAIHVCVSISSFCFFFCRGLGIDTFFTFFSG